MLGTDGDEGIVGTLAGLMSIIAPGVCGAVFGAAAFGAAAALCAAAARAAATAGDTAPPCRTAVFFFGIFPSPPSRRRAYVFCGRRLPQHSHTTPGDSR